MKHLLYIIALTLSFNAFADKEPPAGSEERYINQREGQLKTRLRISTNDTVKGDILCDRQWTWEPVPGQDELDEAECLGIEYTNLTNSLRVIKRVDRGDRPDQLEVRNSYDRTFYLLEESAELSEEDDSDSLGKDDQ